MANETKNPLSVEIRRADVKTITIPDKMEIAKAIEWLQKQMVAEDTKVNIMETFKGITAYEGAVAFFRSLRKIYNFINYKPGCTTINVPLSEKPGDYEAVPWGRVEVLDFGDGYLETSFNIDDDGFSFMVAGQVRRKHEALVKEATTAARLSVKNDSIYKGKAIRVNFDFMWDENKDWGFPRSEPEFFDVSGVSPSDIIFNDDLQAVIDSCILGSIRNAQACRDLQIPLKRGVLMASQWGTGKTLLARMVGAEAVKAGWTFILCNDIRDLQYALRLAARLQPAVVFAEDIDRLVRERNFNTDQILNIIDGVELKNAEIMTILTTNDLDSIDAALLRPGRLDNVITVPLPDVKSIVRLFHRYGGTLLDPNVDFTFAATRLFEMGCTPAVVREIVERSKLTTIARLGVSNLEGTISPSDLVVTANAMKSHIDLLRPKIEDKDSDTVKAAKLVGNAIVTAARPPALPTPSSLVTPLGSPTTLPRSVGELTGASLRQALGILDDDSDGDSH